MTPEEIRGIAKELHNEIEEAGSRGPRWAIMLDCWTTLLAEFVAQRAEHSAPRPAPVAQSSPPAKAPRPIPADAKELSITPLSVTKVGTGDKVRLLVAWSVAGGQKNAACWASEKAIWPRLIEKVKQPITLLVVEKSGYLNIVGVK